MSENKENIKINNNIDENLKLEEDIDVEFDRIWGTDTGDVIYKPGELVKKLKATLDLMRREDESKLNHK